MRRIYAMVLDMLTPAERRRFGLLLVMILAMGIIEAAGVASILPFLAVVSRPELTRENAVLRSLYELGGFESDESFLVALGAAVLGVILFNLAVKTATFYAMNRFAQMRAYSIASRLLTGYLSQPYAWFLNRHGADLAKSVLAEVDVVVNGAVLPAIKVIAYGAIVLFLVALIVAIDPFVALTAAAAVGGAYALVYLAARRLLARIGAERVRMNRARFRAAHETLGGIKEIKVLGLEAPAARRFRAPAERLARIRTLVAVIGELPRQLLEAILFGGMMALLLHMLLTREGGIAQIVPTLGLYAFAGARLFPAMQQLYRDLTALRFSLPTLEAMHADLMATAPRGAPPPLPEPPERPLGLRRALELRGVSYVYPEAGRPALRGLDMTVPARTAVGLVGGTGAGKTTAVDVILGLLEPQEGALIVDGARIGPEQLRAWRRSIGYVPQQIYLADDSVAANIAFGVPPERIDMEAVRRAARIAELHDFVERDLPEGYATNVGERGVRLSGGQRQRIGIARALYHDPDVLVLDEATSALDNLTERAVMDAVRNLGRAKTIIMVAHRLSTVRGCDRIYLLEGGRVAASGTYDELIATSPAFRALAREGG
ncbi:ABC transporter ATP-binding protein [Oceanicella actignis]|uniref:ABC-type bacteriocin/lantibiotic exporter, contains an N-terminal double-glycine peptidase domain n=1 Tax=Oceanicella actignis TaxID=1189325 RepID=A0A1M7T3Z2_9RHOB|nr:ABC transporter ATP-binding protein [Oceanicella actignis]TYO88816.1 ABC-type bacteriocin/lantibiotic exporter with double-glycine peptidase domain [Oceanicella actignis]SET40834.1 ABC-type bacteriocin/lantibiotic exporter, contains an N-terminal double-glycine peptidase domain [Oceanicella actignis]SHN65428.1 ABC-type bacteriocin/lantibiotic exporter, contains an N-terminal double-glycine peptidase domain [Oceanicella actignis]